MSRLTVPMLFMVCSACSAASSDLPGSQICQDLTTHSTGCGVRIDRADCEEDVDLAEQLLDFDCEGLRDLAGSADTPLAALVQPGEEPTEWPASPELHCYFEPFEGGFGDTLQRMRCDLVQNPALPYHVREADITAVDQGVRISREAGTGIAITERSGDNVDDIFPFDLSVSLAYGWDDSLNLVPSSSSFRHEDLTITRSDVSTYTEENPLVLSLPMNAWEVRVELDLNRQRAAEFQSRAVLTLPEGWSQANETRLSTVQTDPPARYRRDGTTMTIRMVAPRAIGYSLRVDETDYTTTVLPLRVSVIGSSGGVDSYIGISEIGAYPIDLSEVSVPTDASWTVVARDDGVSRPEAPFEGYEAPRWTADTNVIEDPEINLSELTEPRELTATEGSRLRIRLSGLEPRGGVLEILDGSDAVVERLSQPEPLATVTVPSSTVRLRFTPPSSEPSEAPSVLVDGIEYR